MLKLPIGIQDFRELRTNGYLYVDKTALVYKLMEEGKYYFLSRPRRFGKSLLVSTIAEVFKGSKNLFDGLWIADKRDWSQTNPIIEMRFNEGAYKQIGLEVDITRRLKEQAEGYQLILEESHYSLQFRELILKLSAKYGKVAVLIDEYDKPIIDFLEDIPRAEANREVLKNLYSVLKPLDSHLQMVFLTGVSKFSRVSIFSELNNLFDLTIHKDYSTLVGYTQSELEYYFADRINELIEKFGDKETLLTEIKEWYNGYTWDGQHYVYNPFSVLSFFGKKEFQNFWFETGTPTFLIKLLQERNIIDLDGFEVDSTVIESFNLRDLATETLLFQTGYITIKKVKPFSLYELGYPNREVRESMLRHMIRAFTAGSQGTAATPALRMAQAIYHGKIADFCQNLNSLLAAIPYDLHQDNEAYYHSITYLALALLGVHIQTETHVASGRLDAVIETEKHIYVIEFKVNQSAQIAIDQLKEKHYVVPYLSKGKQVHGLGINFNTAEKQLDDWTYLNF